MNVIIKILQDCTQCYAVIFTSEITDEVKRVYEMLSNGESRITSLQNETALVVLKPTDIYMVRIECGITIIYGESEKYRSRKRLYELHSQLGEQFMQISKTTLINLSYIDKIEPSFSGTVLLKQKNGSYDYVSRKYLPQLKKYLGI